MWKSKYLTVVGTILLIMLAPSSLAVIRVTNIQITTTNNYTHIEFTLSAKTTYRSSVLKTPDRLVLDLDNAKLVTKLSEVDLSTTPIESIRGGKTNKSALRIVLDLKQTVKFKASAKSSANKNYLINIDLINIPPITPKTDAPVLSAQQYKAPSYLTVVIDPGHGGKDPGATGQRGTHEKDIVLSIAKYLQADLLKVPGIKVCMTRKGDYFVSLRGRISIARKCHGDMFVAIHADAYRNVHARGSSVFALSQRGATSESARWLAERENTSEMLGGNIDLSDKSHLLSSVLIDLSQTATINSSLQLGLNVIRRLSYVARMHTHKVDQAAFVVLKSPDIPSILIETGFLSNYEEERNLRNPIYRQHLAVAIASAIVDYFKAKAPTDTIFAKSLSKQNDPTIYFMSNAATNKKYKVRVGDNVQSIASKYNVSTTTLKKANKLTSNKLKPGQVLIIPQ